MCMNVECGLTMAGMLGDPLIQAMMRSDGVTQEAHTELWERVRDALVARFGMETAGREVVAVA